LTGSCESANAVPAVSAAVATARSVLRNIRYSLFV